MSEDGNEASVQSVVIQPTLVLVDQEIIRRAIECCETAIESTAECLSVHDASLGRTTRKNKSIAERYEKELGDAKRIRNELRCAIGWPEVG